MPTGADRLLCRKGDRAVLSWAYRLPWGQIDNAWETWRGRARPIRDPHYQDPLGHGPGEARPSRRGPDRQGPPLGPRPGHRQEVPPHRLLPDQQKYPQTPPGRVHHRGQGALGREAWHWTRDVVFGEDASHLRSGHGPESLASLRNLVIAVLDALGGQGITALRDQIASHLYTWSLESSASPSSSRTFNDYDFADAVDREGAETRHGVRIGWSGGGSRRVRPRFSRDGCLNLGGSGLIRAFGSIGGAAAEVQGETAGGPFSS